MKGKKVVHILGQLDIGGIESWLVDVVKKTSFYIDYTFIVDKAHKGFYEDYLISMGCNIIHISSPKKKIHYIYDLIVNFLKGDFDICHSHVGHTNGVIALVAKLCRIRTIITHAHSEHITKPGILKRFILDIKIFMANSFADHQIAVSRGAALCHYKTDLKPIKIMPCGKDLSSLISVSPTDLKRQLGISEHKIVLGTVGRLESVKNHHFLIEIIASIRRDDVVLLIVGDGSLIEELIEHVKKLDLSNKVIFTGARTDALLIMRDVIDVFLFPSLNEGLGLAAIEAQASGLPVIASENVPRIIDITKSVIHLNLDNKCSWVDAINGFVDDRRERAVNIDIVNGEFSIESNIKGVLEIYDIKQEFRS
jgi:glycosyltransferase involved in cell wall biosynthesis